MVENFISLFVATQTCIASLEDEFQVANDGRMLTLLYIYWIYVFWLTFMLEYLMFPTNSNNFKLM